MVFHCLLVVLEASDHFTTRQMREHSLMCTHTHGHTEQHQQPQWWLFFLCLNISGVDVCTRWTVGWTNTFIDHRSSLTFDPTTSRPPCLGESLADVANPQVCLVEHQQLRPAAISQHCATVAAFWRFFIGNYFLYHLQIQCYGIWSCEAQINTPIDPTSILGYSCMFFG